MIDEPIRRALGGSWLTRWIAAGRPACGIAQKALSRHLAARSREAALVARVSQGPAQSPGGVRRAHGKAGGVMVFTRTRGEAGAMGWWRMIPGLLRPATELIEVFQPIAGGEAPRDHAERLALSAQDLVWLQQFAANLHPRARRTGWDSFVDGLNRLPRPLLTLGVGAFFVLAPLDPLRFAQIARAYELMPDGFWALLSVIVAFYFGGRIRLDRDDMAIKGGALAAAREVLAVQRAREREEAAELEAQPGDRRRCTGGARARRPAPDA
jgi:hypothetical protein